VKAERPVSARAGVRNIARIRRAKMVLIAPFARFITALGTIPIANARAAPIVKARRIVEFVSTAGGIALIALWESGNTMTAAAGSRPRLASRARSRS
jgi:hypothetical protein